MNDTTETPTALPRASNLPFREDCWSEDATHTLVEAWGERYLELNRGNLRQKHWQEVADAVNSRHASGKKPRRTDVQCKNRIDTLKKKYKLEKSRIVSSNGNLTSKWPFYARLESLIGSTAAAKKTSPPVALPLPYHKNPPQALPHALVVRPPKEKRPPASPAAEDPYFRRNYGNYNNNNHYNGSVGHDVDSGSWRSSSESPRDAGKVDDEGDGFRQLAQAIMRFGEIYERVEEAKQAQMIELEKERMEFAKMLEFERMQLFMDSQVQIEKIKRARRTTATDNYL
ncbi:trihelix transcription factor ENAP1-like isoform X2 [Aristolochia californica]|uniref:trihelix transcription factor ENAP1-like isoform X2 n=1 Tax=Aristolochia californica TaxID=171875 RepID=UPI0035E09FF6